MGQRERRKRETRQRLETAARAIFRAKGYEAATTREIAAEAGIGAGTLFAYAPDKGALLYLVMRGELEAVTAQSFTTVPAEASLLEQLLHVFRARFVFWGEDPALARHAVREFFALQYRPGGFAPDERPELRLYDGLVALVERAQHAGALSLAQEPAVVARMLLDIYLSENREWLLREPPVVDEGIARLRAVLELALLGIATGARQAHAVDAQLGELVTTARALGPADLSELTQFAAFRASRQC
jgi:AcrR family transcriptional regulator